MAKIPLDRILEALRPASRELPSGQKLLYPLRDIMGPARPAILRGTSPTFHQTLLAQLLDEEKILKTMDADSLLKPRLLPPGDVPVLAKPRHHGHKGTVWKPEDLDPEKGASELKAGYTSTSKKLAKNFARGEEDLVTTGFVKKMRLANLDKRPSPNVIRGLAKDAGMSEAEYRLRTKYLLERNPELIEDSGARPIGRGKYAVLGDPTGYPITLGTQLRIHDAIKDPRNVGKAASEAAISPFKYGERSRTVEVLRRLGFGGSEDIDWFYRARPEFGGGRVGNKERLPTKAPETHIFDKGSFVSPRKQLNRDPRIPILARFYDRDAPDATYNLLPKQRNRTRQERMDQFWEQSGAKKPKPVKEVPAEYTDRHTPFLFRKDNDLLSVTSRRWSTLMSLFDQPYQSMPFPLTGNKSEDIRNIFGLLDAAGASKPVETANALYHHMVTGSGVDVKYLADIEKMLKSTATDIPF